MQKILTEIYLISKNIKNTDFKIIPIKTNDIYISSQSITKEGFVKTYPFMYSNKGGMDGFFVAKLEKKN